MCKGYIYHLFSLTHTHSLTLDYLMKATQERPPNLMYGSTGFLEKNPQLDYKKKIEKFYRMKKEQIALAPSQRPPTVSHLNTHTQ
jgi:hypothetical protein